MPFPMDLRQCLGRPAVLFQSVLKGKGLCRSPGFSPLCCSLLRFLSALALSEWTSSPQLKECCGFQFVLLEQETKTFRTFASFVSHLSRDHRLHCLKSIVLKICSMYFCLLCFACFSQNLSWYLQLHHDWKQTVGVSACTEARWQGSYILNILFVFLLH